MRTPNAWRLVLLWLFVVPTGACTTPTNLVAEQPAEQFVGPITPSRLRQLTSQISSDALLGRGPGTQGDQKARAYLVDELRGLGLTPGFAGQRWQQPFSLLGLHSHPPKAWRFETPNSKSVALTGWQDYMVNTGAQGNRVAVKDAEVVFVGYGIQAPEEGWDDFKGTNLADKVLLMLNNDPDWDPDLFAGKRRLYYGRWTYKYESAARQKAAGAIIIHTDSSAGYPWQVVQRSSDGAQFELPANGEQRLQLAGWLTSAAAERLVALGGQELGALIAAAKKREFRPIPLGVRTSIAFDVTKTQVETANVGGLLRGSDPELRNEVVIYTAHHDHLGVGGADDGGDAIYNGARDNGLAMAQTLAVARAMSVQSSRPKRSVLFLFVGAEEQGLLGSKYYAQKPSFHSGKIAANLNLELGNIWGPTHDVVVYGAGKSTLERILGIEASRQGRRMIPQADVDKGWYYRSDQFSFARIGVPALWFNSGTHFVGKEPAWGIAQQQAWIKEHYHQPSDQVRAEWRFDGAAQDAELALAVGLWVANAAAMPNWNPGDEFADERQAALSAVQP